MGLLPRKTSLWFLMCYGIWPQQTVAADVRIIDWYPCLFPFCVVRCTKVTNPTTWTVSFALFILFSNTLISTDDRQYQGSGLQRCNALNILWCGRIYILFPYINLSQCSASASAIVTTYKYTVRLNTSFICLPIQLEVTFWYTQKSRINYRDPSRIYKSIFISFFFPF